MITINTLTTIIWWLNLPEKVENVSSKGVEFTKETPIFATADAPMVLVRAGSIDHVNTQMVQVRWRHFHLWKQIPENEQIRLIPCKRCFSKLILDKRSPTT